VILKYTTGQKDTDRNILYSSGNGEVKACYIERKLEKNNVGIPMTFTVLLSVVLPSFMMELSP